MSGRFQVGGRRSWKAADRLGGRVFAGYYLHLLLRPQSHLTDPRRAGRLPRHPFGRGQSERAWRYNESLVYEAAPVGHPARTRLLLPKSGRRGWRNYGASYGAAFGEIAEKLQVPAEILVAIVAKDSPAGGSLRRERSRSEAHDLVTGTGTNAGFSTSVPSNLGRDAEVKAGTNLEWDDLVTVVKLTGGQRGAAPGIMQALIGIARNKPTG